MSVTVLQEKCDPKNALDKKLPYTAYLVEYTDKDNLLCYDIAIAGKAVDLFDHYYDKYKKDFKKFTQSAGTVDPRRWIDVNKQKATPPRKTRKRRKTKEEDGED